MKTWRWLVILLPTLLGLGLSFYFSLVFDRAHPHIVYLRADLGALSLLIGLLLSLVAVLVFGLLAWRERIHQNAGSLAAEQRRRFLRRLDHELKNPLTALRAGLVNLAESSPEPAHRATLSGLEAQALRLSRLSTDLRKLAEI